MANHKPIKPKNRKRKNKITQPYARWVPVDECRFVTLSTVEVPSPSWQQMVYMNIAYLTGTSDEQPEEQRG